MISFAAALLLVASTSSSSPARPGECKWVHGRFALYNGSGVRRIWIIGTRRIVALRDEDEQIPPEVEQYQRDAAGYTSYADALFGDFYVCALERSRPGHMQHIRLERTRNLKFRGKPFPPK